MVDRPCPRTGSCGWSPPSMIGARKTSTASTSPASRKAPSTRPPPSTRTFVAPRRPNSSSSAPIGTGPSPGERQDLAAEAGQGGRAARPGPGRSRPRRPGPRAPSGPAGSTRGSRAAPSRMTRAATRGPGGRAVRRGSSASTVPMPDDDRVHPPSQGVDQGPRPGARDPAAVPAGRGDLAVEGHRPLGRHVRPARRQPLQVGRVEPPGLVPARPDLDPDQHRASRAKPPPATRGIWVAHRGDHPGDARVEDGPGARRGLADVAARLQGDVQRRTPARPRPRADRAATSACGPAEPVVMADGDEPVVADDHGADHRVGLDAPQAARGLGQGPLHPEFVALSSRGRSRREGLPARDGTPCPMRSAPTGPLGRPDCMAGGTPGAVRTGISGPSAAVSGAGAVRGAGAGSARGGIGHLIAFRIGQAIQQVDSTSGVVRREGVQRFAEPTGEVGLEPAEPVGETGVGLSSTM